MKIFKFLFVIITLCGCRFSGSEAVGDQSYSGIALSRPDEGLIRFHSEEYYEPGILCGYRNFKGDTIIPLGKYTHCYTDTFKTYAIVSLDSGSANRLIAIDRNEKLLYGVMWFDNGPDWIEEGFFRILRDGKIGYANEQGEVVIIPQFECAEPFRNGRARVAYQCDLVKERNDSEHTSMKSLEWFYIDHQGNRID